MVLCTYTDIVYTNIQKEKEKITLSLSFNNRMLYIQLHHVLMYT